MLVVILRDSALDSCVSSPPLLLKVSALFLIGVLVVSFCTLDFKILLNILVIIFLATVSLIVDTEATAKITEDANNHFTVSSFGIP